MGKGSVWMQLAIGVGVATMVVSAHAKDALLTMEQFRELLAREIAHQFPKAESKPIGDNQLQVQLPGSAQTTMSLDRIYGLYEGTPTELRTIVANAAASLRDARAMPAAKALLVLIRPAAYNPAPQSGTDPDRGIAKPLPGGMIAIVAMDTPSSYVISRRSKLVADLKMSEQQIWATALANTNARLPLQPQPIPAVGIGQIKELDGLASSALLNDRFWDSPDLTAHGPMVVAPFARDYLLFAALGDEASVQRLKKMMSEVRDDPNGLTNSLIVRREGHWEVLP